MGSIDGKHVNIQVLYILVGMRAVFNIIRFFFVKAFANSGSDFYNYKGTHSIVLLAIADANYKFIFVDIGTPGRHSDSGIFKTSTFGRLVTSDPHKLNIPNKSVLPGSEKECPYVFVADEAFPLLHNIMRPYPGRGSNQRMEKSKAIFNYRLSRARRVVENAFGIYASKFRIFNNCVEGYRNKLCESNCVFT